MHFVNRAAGVGAAPRHDAQPMPDLGPVAARRTSRSRAAGGPEDRAARTGKARAPSQPDASNRMFRAASPVKKPRMPFKNPGVEVETFEMPVFRAAGPSFGV